MKAALGFSIVALAGLFGCTFDAQELRTPGRAASDAASYPLDDGSAVATGGRSGTGRTLDGQDGGGGAGELGGSADAGADAPIGSSGEVGGNGGTSIVGGAGGNGGTSGTGGVRDAGSDVSLGGGGSADAVLGGNDGARDAGIDTPVGGGGVDALLAGRGGTGGAGGATGSGGTTGGDNPCVGQPDFTTCTVVTTPDRHYDICVEGTCVSPGCGDATCNVPGPHFVLADTDQRFCYDNSVQLTCPASESAFLGQDAQHGWDMLHAESERFTRETLAANQPVVTDKATGLVWQGCPSGLTGTACNSGSASTFLWSDALAYCDGLSWGGQKDWHLPDPYELQSITDLGTQNPAIDTTAFPATPSTTPAGARVFWSSSSYAGNPSSAWYQSFFGGGMYSIDKSNNGYVRCVRGGRASGSARFSRNTSATGQPIVTDSVTELSWQGCTAGLTGSDCAGGTVGSHDWANALGYCAGLDWGGHQDWRLPNAKELRSIVNERRAVVPIIDVAAFPNTPADWFWSSSTNMGAPGNAWYVSLNNGNVDSNVKAGGYRVRCVRSGP